ncbi:MAG TPA: PP2C family protein-serine/threonine phosphatase [Thermoanaerobaculia bacterium]|nr:PP2C family protein-serine/threonine phosphatase [Thermoanaerobaculia bacterium]
MRKASWVGWFGVAALGALALYWVCVRTLPTLPAPWTTTRAEATALALEKIAELGPPVPNPYVVVSLDGNHLLERRLQLSAVRPPSRLLSRVVDWEVLVYPRGVTRDEWTYRIEISLSGEVLSLSRRVDRSEPGAALTEPEARRQARAFLVARGVDLSPFGDPEIRRTQLSARTDSTVRFPVRRSELQASKATYGVEVTFAGDRLTGFGPWFEDPGRTALQPAIRQMTFTGIAGLMILFGLLFALAPPFLTRYHEGLIGVRRAAQVFGLVSGTGLLVIALVARSSSQSLSFGVATREQTTWLFAMVITLFNLLPSGIAAFFAWGVGESICREHWGGKLAAFDALFLGEWGNATVARSALAGVSGGIALAGGLALLNLPLARLEAWPMVAFLLPSSEGSAAPSIELVAVQIWGCLAPLLAILLCVLPTVERRLGPWLGGLVGAVLLTPFVFSAAMPIPVPAGLLVAFVLSSGVVAIFRGVDLLAALLAAFVAGTVLSGYPLLVAADSSLQAHGWAALGLLALPLVLSLRFLGSDKERVYRYEDIPPHVRRIAERERQRVELETARGIQSSILPDLPPRLGGFDIAHTYLPASEVGGDFYDVLALEDGRVAVAIGDVAGHGVSSGLVMSMAKSALAVQVTFDPAIEAVFATLNRTVFQSARRRLLTTLCYALIDPIRREVHYASAGHLYPYLVSKNGRVEPLESIAYPLGVRGQLDISPRAAKVAPGDAIFLFSDGLVEAQGTKSDESYGFERLEKSLARHAAGSVEALQRGVLADLDRFTGAMPREDDLTILVLRVGE